MLLSDEAYFLLNSRPKKNINKQLSSETHNAPHKRNNFFAIQIQPLVFYDIKPFKQQRMEAI